MALRILSHLARYPIKGDSMWPVLHHGDMVLACSVAIGGKPKRGDIVIFKDKAGDEWVKQVMGLPNETVRIARERILINGEPLRRYKPDVERNYRFGPVTVPPGQYFMLGINTGISEDSRHFGTVPEANILYRPLAIYRPPWRLDVFFWWMRFWR